MRPEVLLSEVIKASDIKMTVKQGVHSRFILDDQQKKYDSWTIILRYNGHTMTQAYFTGKGLNRIPPTIAEVINSLLFDCLIFDNSGDYEEFSKTFDYEDRKQGKRAFNRCGKIKANLQRVLGKELFESLYYAEDDITEV